MEPKYSRAGVQDDSEHVVEINEALLRSEIGFWREMIGACSESQSPESVERMHHALALAETRLAALFSNYQDAAATGKRRPSNVYQLRLGGQK